MCLKNINCKNCIQLMLFIKLSYLIKYSDGKGTLTLSQLVPCEMSNDCETQKLDNFRCQIENPTYNDNGISNYIVLF